MFQTVADSIAIVHLASPLLALISLIVFEIPRYVLSTVVLALFGLRPDTNPARSVTISVILPAFNNADSLAGTLASLRRQTAQIVEIILINEGSTDDTLTRARDFKARGLITRIIQHGTRTGKSAAINHAARFAKGDLILVLDVDTVLSDPDALAKLAAAFGDPSVAAASGNLLVHNRDESLWTSLQSIEYLASLTAGRSFLDVIDSIACCSGAFTLFRRSVFRAVGGMNVGSGEDLEMTLRLRGLGYRVRFIADAVALTRVPSRFSALVRQRLRWDRDALCIRIFMYRQLFRIFAHERLGDTLQRLDFLVFEFFPALIFPFYLAYLVSAFGADAPGFLLGVYIYLLGFCVIHLIVVMMTTPARLTWYDILVVPAVPLYQGLIMRFVRFYAFVSEIFFNRSRSDDFVPPRVRKALYGRVRHAA